MANLHNRLTKRQERFVEEYLETWNATEAARRAGYQGNNLHVMGYRALKHPLVKARIEERIRQSALGADETLLRLSQMAKTNIADFIEPDGHGGVELNWEKIQESGHLVKSIKVTENGYVLELEDRQAAMDKLLKAGGVYKSNVDVTSGGQPLKGYVSVSPDDWDASPAE